MYGNGKSSFLSTAKYDGIIVIGFIVPGLGNSFVESKLSSSLDSVYGSTRLKQNLKTYLGWNN